MPKSAFIQRMEALEEGLVELSRFLPECLCFPKNEPPCFVPPFFGHIAFAVKCPLHGDRFKWPIFETYAPPWFRRFQARRRERGSAQFKKAWAAAFPEADWVGYVPGKNEIDLHPGAFQAAAAVPKVEK